MDGVGEGQLENVVVDCDRLSGMYLLSALHQGGRRGQELTRAGQELTRAGQELTRAGQELTRAGQELTRAGQELTRAGPGAHQKPPCGKRKEIRVGKVSGCQG
ncbi:unnamed protein product [Arctogadus glacialis]